MNVIASCYKKGRQREAELAAINSAMQSIGSVLDQSTLRKFVKSVTDLVPSKPASFSNLPPIKMS